MQFYLEKLLDQKSLSVQEMMQATKLCFSEEITTSEVAAFLTALRAKGETAAEIAGLVQVIRQHAKLKNIKITNVMDNCGTGGDQSSSFNISTTAAFVIAGAGKKVAKHGNRNISSQTSSDDVLEYFGVSLALTHDEVKYILRHNNIVFLYAPNIHQSLKRFLTIRRYLTALVIL